MLSFTLLGQVALAQDGVSLSQFRSQKEPALLIYLAHTGETHRRDYLADLLWEGSSTKQSLSNLRTALARLRKQVGDALEITRKTLALTPESRQQVDSVILLRSLAGMSSVDTAEKAVILRKTLATYQGPFLDDFHLDDAPQFNEWATVTRAHIHRQVLAAYDKLGQYAVATSDVDSGLGVARQWLQVDELDETAHALLIQMHLAAGNVRTAVAHYDYVAERLHTELGVAPSPQLTALIKTAQPQRTTIARPATTIQHNLPAEHDQFFGRGEIQQEIHVRLDQPWCRLMTIVGQGGVGKTRLATTIGRSRLSQYPDGVWLAELENVDSEDEDVAEAVAVEIATVLGMRLAGAKPPIEQVVDFLRHKQALLILDNFEHVLTDGLTAVLELIEQCEQVQMLVTSRETLRVRAEWSIALHGLRYPTAVDDDLPAEAVDLFLARRAQQKHDPIDDEGVAAVRQICRMVEGLPLAIELAAALTRHTATQAIAKQLQDGFGALQTTLRDMPEKHRGLQVVFEMSWRTLSPALQTRLARLAVFRGGFTAVAVQEVAEVSQAQLAVLVEKSLVIHQDEAERYRLHPVVRAYALGKLPEEDGVTEAHGRYYLQHLADHVEPLQQARPQDSMAVLAPEIENVRQAWQTGLATKEIALLTAALPALSVYYQLQSVAQEGVAVMGETMTTAVGWGTEGTHLATRAGLERARFQNRLSRHHQAISTLKKVVKWAQANGDSWAEGMAAVWWGEALWRLSEYDAAREKLQAAMAIGESLGEAAIVGWSHHQLGIVNDIQGHYDEAQQHLEQACARWRKLDNAQCLSNSLNSLGVVRYHRGDYARAQDVMSEALVLCNELGNRHVQMALLSNLSMLATEQKDYAGARYYLQLSLQLAIGTGNLLQQTKVLINLGWNLYWLGELDTAVDYLHRSLHLAESTNNIADVVIALTYLGSVRRAQGTLTQAESLYQRALDTARQNGLQRSECLILLDLAELWRDMDKQRARKSGQQALRLAEEMQNPQVLERANELVRSLAMQDDMA